MAFLVIAVCLTVGVLVGYQWGYDIGFHDAKWERTNATLRERINNAAARLHLFERKQ
jgi:hypothetical protein